MLTLDEYKYHIGAAVLCLGVIISFCLCCCCRRHVHRRNTQAWPMQESTRSPFYGDTGSGRSDRVMAAFGDFDSSAREFAGVNPMRR